MKDTAFHELLASVRQAGAIRRGTRRPARTTTFEPTDVQAVRAKLGASQAEFALMIGAGMPPMEAIKAATLNAADLLELSNNIGSIEAGKAADIIAVDKDPTREVRTLERMRFVMRGGVVYVGP